MSAAMDPHEMPDLPGPENWPVDWPSFETFVAYFDGALLPEEEAQVRALLEREPRARAFARELAQGLAAPTLEAESTAAPALRVAPREVAPAPLPLEQRTPSPTLRLVRSRRWLAAAAVLLIGGGALLFFALRSRPSHFVSEGFALATQLSVIGDLGGTLRGPGGAAREAIVARAGSELVLSAAVPEDAHAWFAVIERESGSVATLSEVALRVAEQRVALTRYRVPEARAGRTLWLLSMVATHPLGRAEEDRVQRIVREARDARAGAEALRASFGCVIALRPLEILPAEGERKIGARVPRAELRDGVAEIEKALRRGASAESAAKAIALIERAGYTSGVAERERLLDPRWEIAEAARLHRAALAWEQATPELRAKAQRADEARAALAREFPLLVARGERDAAAIDARLEICREAANSFAALSGDELSLRWLPVHLEGQLLLQLAGDAMQALTRLEAARAGLAAAGAERHPRYASVLNDLAGACRALGELERARQFAAGALRIYEEAEVGGRVLFEVLRSLADLHRAVGANELADEHARAAEAVLAAAEDEGGRETALLHLHLTRASLEESAGAFEEAERELHAAEELARRSGDERRLDTLRARRAEHLLRRGDASAAAALLEELRARDVARFGAEHAYVALDDHALGRCFARLGRPEEALARWERAFLHFEQRLVDEGELSARLDVAAHAEIEAIASAWSDLLLQRGEIARAFEVRERSRASALLALFAPAELEAGPREKLRELRARKSALHAEIEALVHARSSDAALERELTARQHALADLLQQEWLAERAASQALRDARPAAAPLRASELREALGNTVALWCFAWSAERVDLLWLSPEANELRAEPLARDARATAELAALVARALSALRDPAQPLSALDEPLRALGAQLLPNAVLEGCAEARAIALVLDGPLAELPLEALIVDGDASAPRFVLEVAPPLSRVRSLATLRALRQEPARRSASSTASAALLVGAPAFLRADRSAVEAQAFARSAQGASAEQPQPLAAPRLAEIPETAAELHLVAAILGARGVGVESLLGTEATASRVAERAASKRLVHLASHGRRAEEWRPQAAGIALAPEASAPQEPGLLDLETVLRTWPRGAAANALVVLSACESGAAGKKGAARELALPAAFQRLGVPSVIATLWSIDSAATVPLIAALYEALAEQELSEPARALQRAQRVVRGATNDPR
ncbi:MAG: CHAT domain-containing protein, partial [Planctomycetes bacterium]|nr:CHAT domain-containing protein [Planctomycetota bacterium]